MHLLPLSSLRSVGQYKSSDYFAILGLPITAEPLQIRQRYLNIVRNLHPDVHGRTPEEKHKACEYLAKLVSPAYNMLMQNRERVECYALLKLIARRLMKQDLRMTPKSKAARRLLASPSVEHYTMAVEAIAKLQYESLDKILEYTDQLGELNLIYIMYEEGYHPSLYETSQERTPAFNLSGLSLDLVELSSVLESPQSTAKHDCLNQQLPQDKSQPDIPSRLNHRVQGYLRLVEDYINQNPEDTPDYLPQRVQSYLQLAEYHISQCQWMMAWGALHTALHLDHTNSRCHALLGLVYLNQNLVGMAKVSFQQALKINPREPLALQHIAKCVNAIYQKSRKYGSGTGFFGWLGSSY